MIAIALMCEPELIIADESTMTLDVTIQAKILCMLRELQQELGTAVILSLTILAWLHASPISWR
ncbi:MAG: hypothetical protein ACR5LD_02835 [Symbiopectobacterium sp.]